MDITNAFELTVKVLSIGGTFSALVLFLAEQKATIARNRRRIERLESALEKAEKEIYSLIAVINNTQIKLTHIEEFLDRNTDFSPVITRTDFDLSGRYK